MWVMVLFDLPTSTKADRQAYMEFRNFLLDQGFEMAQFSVYIKHTNGQAESQAVIKKVERAMPEAGKVDILQFTDKQYENIICLRGKKGRDSLKNPQQLALF